VFESQFFGSTVADMAYGNCGYFSIRDNFSYGSKRFVYAPDSGCALQLAIQRNIAIASYSNDSTPVIYLGICPNYFSPSNSNKNFNSNLNIYLFKFTGGPDYVTLLDNIFVNDPESKGPIFVWNRYLISFPIFIFYYKLILMCLVGGWQTVR
jgi:hypothetical protein